MKKTRVIVVDDSALVRSLLAEIINRQSDMECIGTANDPLIAREMIREMNPDVITLDVEMPKMDGIEFLGRLMRLRPMPVVMLSSLTQQGSETTMRALELGAIDFIAKPRLGIKDGIAEYAELVADKIRAAYHARCSVKRRASVMPAQASAEPRAVGNRLISSEKVIIIGASTGGTEAIREFLMQMPRDCPGILIAQHMPEGFTQSFARRLDSLCRIGVTEAVQGERVVPGHAYIAPGNAHLLLGRSGANYLCRLDSGEPVNRHRPSVEVLFRSAALHAGRNAIGVILTGMGKDGALGMLEMRQAGAYNFAQDEASCVVYGMPREAVLVGAVHEVAPLDQLAGLVLSRLGRHSERALPI